MIALAHASASYPRLYNPRTEDRSQLGEVRKCDTPGCVVHVYPGRVCSSCGRETVELREWRRAVDAGEIVR